MRNDYDDQEKLRVVCKSKKRKMAVLSRFRAVLRMYPVIRGMISYSTIWPTSCLLQQTIIEGKNYTNYNYWAALRFSIYGGLYTAPTLYCWIRLTTFIWPKTSLRTAITKAIIEQMTYGPFALCSFFFGMTLLEGRGFHAATHEVSQKFWPSYRIAVCVWPILQTINFTYIKERNRVPFVSMCSLVWTSFLAYMHHLQTKQMAEQQQSSGATLISSSVEASKSIAQKDQLQTTNVPSSVKPIVESIKSKLNQIRKGDKD